MTSPSSSLAKGCEPLKHLSLWGTLGNLENLILWSISGHLKQLIPWGHLGTSSPGAPPDSKDTFFHAAPHPLQSLSQGR